MINRAAELVEALRQRGLTCATAESCTGGGIGYYITSVPGASAVFQGGIISYANDVKRDILKVSETVLTSVGAVSSECAGAMAAGARRLTGADLAVAVTGIAGPDGGTAEKPVGLVWFGIATAQGLATEKRIFKGSREEVREQTIEHALECLLSAAEFGILKGNFVPEKT